MQYPTPELKHFGLICDRVMTKNDFGIFGSLTFDVTFQPSKCNEVLQWPLYYRPTDVTDRQRAWPAV